MSRRNDGKYVKTTLRIPKELWKEFKVWLIKNDYRSFNEFAIECIRKSLEGGGGIVGKEGRIPDTGRSGRGESSEEKDDCKKKERNEDKE